MKKSKQLILTEELEKKSKYSFNKNIDYHRWHWKDNKGNIGYLRAITEMEAIDRLREAFPEVGSITWISQKNYNELC
ncbi:hypothetical protein ACTS94_05060 [Empedobacter falsenii]